VSQEAREVVLRPEREGQGREGDTGNYVRQAAGYVEELFNLSGVSEVGGRVGKVK
jgi:hypothetical protein